MGNHRLKSLWRLEGENRWMDPQGERESIIADANVGIALNGKVTDFNVKPSDKA